MVLGAFLGILTLYILWFRKPISAEKRLVDSTVMVSLYWLSQIPAIFFPGTLLQDKGVNYVHFPVIFGIKFNQLMMNCTVIFPLILLAYYLERKRINHFIDQ